MNSQILLDELQRNYEWYRVKGKRFKNISYVVRIIYGLLFASSAITMSAFGASVISVSLGIAGAAIFIADRSFGITRNWLEFSYLEVKLAGSIALIKFHDERGEADAALQEFKSTMTVIEEETLGWQVDIREGLAEMRKLLPERV
ncbi:hypothetical protein G6L35_13810 [Agrobacterium tumefaciens]|uniref:hypothetical protein n=1 Tax=Agrobacterium tumefaciens TaxID=358 RepID=UPI001574849E|nr:hypothetical protein [Agrobacterium tumefaciens]NSZ69708.1 hypothetical protein [Agrobacterium tumefaciens]